MTPLAPLSLYLGRHNRRRLGYIEKVVAAAQKREREKPSEYRDVSSSYGHINVHPLTGRRTWQWHSDAALRPSLSNDSIDSLLSRRNKKKVLRDDCQYAIKLFFLSSFFADFFSPFIPLSFARFSLFLYPSPELALPGHEEYIYIYVMYVYTLFQFSAKPFPTIWPNFGSYHQEWNPFYIFI